MLETYRPSGRFSPMIFAYGAGLAVVLCIAGWIYQLAVDWIPLIYITFLITIGFAIVVGFISGMVMQYAKTRNAMVASIVAVAAALSAVAATHYYSYVRATDSTAALAEVQAEAPGLSGADIRGELGLWEYVQLRADEGWSVGRVGRDGGGGISGVVVWAFWIAEALVIAAGAFIGAAGAASNPFCENCGEWADKERLQVTIKNPPKEVIANIASADSLGQILSAQSAGRLSDNRMVYTVKCCPSCSEANFLDVVSETTEKNSKGEDETKSRNLWSGVVLSEADVKQVEAFAGQRSGEESMPVGGAV